MNVEAFINPKSVFAYHNFTFRTAKLRIIFKYTRGNCLKFRKIDSHVSNGNFQSGKYISMLQKKRESTM